jgi:hypothetical protein
MEPGVSKKSRFHLGPWLFGPCHIKWDLANPRHAENKSPETLMIIWSEIIREHSFRRLTKHPLPIDWPIRPCAIGKGCFLRRGLSCWPLAVTAPFLFVVEVRRYKYTLIAICSPDLVVGLGGWYGVPRKSSRRTSRKNREHD